MFDREAAELLDLIREDSPDGSYKILARDELLARMPKRYGTDREGLAQAMAYLAEEGLILLKYADEKSFCVATTAKGRLHGQPAAAAVGPWRWDRALTILAVCLGALGTVLGILGIVF